MRTFLKPFQHGARPEPINLTNIRIASPRPADWNKMVGDERVRHCAECNLNVYNLSAMTERLVQQLIEDSRGKRGPTRFYRRADGTILTQDCPWSFRSLTRKVSRIAAAALTAIMGVTVAMARNKPQPATCECSQSQQKDSGIKLVVVDQHGAVIPKAEIHLQNKLGKGTIIAVAGSTESGLIDNRGREISDHRQIPRLPHLHWHDRRQRWNSTRSESEASCSEREHHGGGKSGARSYHGDRGRDSDRSS